MGIVNEAERQVALLVPGVAPARFGFYAIGAAIVALAVAFIIWWVFIHPGQLADEAERAKGASIIAAGQAAAATDATHTVTEHYNHDQVTVTLQEKGSHAIETAPGAQSVVPVAVGDAARAAICMYASARRDPACVKLRVADPPGVADGGALSTAPAS